MDAVAGMPTGRARVRRQGLNQRQEARGLRRDVDRRDNRSVGVIRKRLILEVGLEGLSDPTLTVLRGLGGAAGL